MISATDRKVILIIVTLLTVGMLGAACGKKAPPRPPGSEAAPPAAGLLSKTISGDTLHLTWRLIAAKDVAGFYVYRSKTARVDSECRSCPVMFERVAVIPYRGAGSDDDFRLSFEYRETVERGYRYLYKVAAYFHGGSTGRDSNTVEFTR